MTPGTRLGPYEVVSLLGAGGMGEQHAVDIASLIVSEIELRQAAIDSQKERM